MNLEIIYFYWFCCIGMKQYSVPSESITTYFKCQGKYKKLHVVMKKIHCQCQLCFLQKGIPYSVYFISGKIKTSIPAKAGKSPLHNVFYLSSEQKFWVQEAPPDFDLALSDGTMPSEIKNDTILETEGFWINRYSILFGLHQIQTLKAISHSPNRPRLMICNWVLSAYWSYHT